MCTLIRNVAVDNSLRKIIFFFAVMKIKDKRVNNKIYYMISSVSGQDETNLLL